MKKNIKIFHMDTINTIMSIFFHKTSIQPLHYRTEAKISELHNTY